MRGILLGSRRVPRRVAEELSYSRPVRVADRAIRKGAVAKGKRTVSKYQKKLSKHLKQERAKATKKNGDFKKGQSMKTVMAKAHKCVKKEMRKR